MKRSGWRQRRKKRLGQWKTMIGKEEDQSDEKHQFLEVEKEGQGDVKPIIGKKRDQGDGT